MNKKTLVKSEATCQPMLVTLGVKIYSAVADKHFELFIDNNGKTIAMGPDKWLRDCDI